MLTPYIEQPNDLFNPTVNQMDWLEIISDGGVSAGEAHFSNDDQEATLVGYIPWNKQRSCIEYMVGQSYVDDSYILHRTNPEAHPIFPWLYVDKISFKSFNPMVNLANPSAPLQFVSPWYTNNPSGLVTINVANHRLAVCALTFRSFQYAFYDDSVITDSRLEWVRNCYFDNDPKVEALSADGIGQLYWAETGPAGPPQQGPTIKKNFPAPITELLGKVDLKMYWFNVPWELLSDDNELFKPSNILACLGNVNSEDFPFGATNPYPPNTLLMLGVHFKRKVFPIASNTPNEPLISFDVTVDFSYFDPPQGAPDPLSAGHVTMPYRGAPTDPTGGKFFYATRGGNPDDPALLASTDLNQIFVSPNA